MRVFFDTNVLVSALATRGLCADVLRLTLADHILVTGDVVIEELRRVLTHKLTVPHRVVREVEQFLLAQEVVSLPDELPDIALRDTGDLRILASAMAGRADVLVTGDREFLNLSREIPLRVVDPRGFWELLRKRRRS